MSSPKLNEAIDDFERMDQFGNLVRLEDLKRHRYAIIYFYSKDNTPG